MSKSDVDIFPADPSDPLKRLLLYFRKMLHDLDPVLIRRYYPTPDFFQSERLRKDVLDYMNQYGLSSYSDMCISDKGITRDDASSLPYRLLPIDASTLRNYLRSGSSRRHRPSAAVQSLLCEFFHRPAGYYCSVFPDDEDLDPMILAMLPHLSLDFKREIFVQMNQHFQAKMADRNGSSEKEERNP